jgi:hypothetical protein
MPVYIYIIRFESHLREIPKEGSKEDVGNGQRYFF